MSKYDEMTWDDWVAKVKSFSALKSGWDSYGADPIKPTAIDRAIKIIDELRRTKISPNDVFICPSRKGLVVFEIEEHL